MNDSQKVIFEYNEIKARILAFEKQLLELSKPSESTKKWEPKGGNFYVGTGGSVSMFDSRVFTKEFGMERQTREQAERAAIEMRRFNRLLALRDELCGDDVLDLYSDSKKYCLFYVDKEWRHTDTSVMVLTPYFTTKDSAQKACDMLNSGEVEL